jgi:mono/diheme cytochrome c family protein
MSPAVLHRGTAIACLAVAAAVSGAVAVAVSQPTPAAAGAAPVAASAASAAAATDGRALYNASCAQCHGSSGMGDGPAADLLAVKPRDFTRGVFKFRSTASGSLPTDDDLLRIVNDGLAGTSMVGFKGLLTPDEQRAVVQYMKQFSPRFATEAPRAVALGPEPPADAARIEAGRQVYATLQCAACHGEGGQPSTAVASSLQDDWGHTVAASKLDEPWTFRAGSSARDIALRLKTGIDGTPMPGVADLATDTEIWNVALYVRSLARTPLWEMTAEQAKAHFAAEDSARAATPVERGRQLTEVCAHCHSPVDRQNRIIPGLKFAGGQRFKLSIWGEVVTTNLTADKDTGLGAYTDEEILRAVTKGIRRDGSRMLPFPMGWPAFAHLSPADQAAMVAYLRTIPPVRNQIPPRVVPGTFTYLAAKFRMLVLGVDEPMVVYSGNAGSLSEGQVRQ